MWVAIGVVPLAALAGFRHLSAAAVNSRWLPATAGAVIALAGAYQFTPWKALCLRACRSPMWFVLSHDFGGGARSAIRAGSRHRATFVPYRRRRRGPIMLHPVHAFEARGLMFALSRKTLVGSYCSLTATRRL
ncbi:MAG: DUF2182 domain-containing protein [Actinomycetota bacterium]